jgi:hypothetical protein
MAIHVLESPRCHLKLEEHTQVAFDERQREEHSKAQKVAPGGVSESFFKCHINKWKINDFLLCRRCCWCCFCRRDTQNHHKNIQNSPVASYCL